MGQVFVRIDDRLIHGQIVTAWCNTLNVGEIIAIDDNLAQNPMLQSIVIMGVPKQYHPSIVTTEKAKELLQTETQKNRLVITRFAKNIAELKEFYPTFEHINLGNCSKQDKTAYTLPSGAGRNLSLTEDDMQVLNEAATLGRKIICQLLPTDKMRTWAQMTSNI